MLRALTFVVRELGDEDVVRAMDSPSLRSALEGWSQLTGDDDIDRLDRAICYGLIHRDSFMLAYVLKQIEDQGTDVEREHIRESLTRLEMALIIGREAGIYYWQVTLWRELVLAEIPEKRLVQLI